MVSEINIRERCIDISVHDKERTVGRVIREFTSK